MCKCLHREQIKNSFVFILNHLIVILKNARSGQHSVSVCLLLQIMLYVYHQIYNQWYTYTLIYRCLMPNTEIT